MAERWEDKGAHNSTIRMSFYTIIYVCVSAHHSWRCSQNVHRSPASWEVYYISSGNPLLVAGYTLTFWILGRLRLHPPARTQAPFKALHYSYNSRRLILINAHVTWWPHCWTDQARASHGAQNENKMLQRSQRCHKSEFQHQCKTAITTRWTESSWQLDRVLEQWWTTGRQKGS